MAHYLVTAKPILKKIKSLENSLKNNEFLNLQPFGKAISFSLLNARLKENGLAVWEEEDYCDPPLKEEKFHVLKYFFEDINAKEIKEGEGWNSIKELPEMFPALFKKSAHF